MYLPIRNMLSGLLLALSMTGSPASARQGADGAKPVADLAAKAQAAGGIDLIVGVRLDRSFRAEGDLSAVALAGQRQEIQAAQDRVRQKYAARVLHTFDTIPFVLLHADAETVALLGADGDVASLEEDRLAAPILAETTTQIGMPQLWNGGLDGRGWTIAQLDTGVELTHPFLQGKIAGGACFSRTYADGSVSSTCPAGEVDNEPYPGVVPGVDLVKQLGSGAAVPCDLSRDLHCEHGTKTAGVAVGANDSFSGVAKGSTLLPIQVFSYRRGQPTRSFFGDQLRALAYLFETARLQHRIAAVTISIAIANEGFAGQRQCDRQEDGTIVGGAYEAAVSNLRSVGIPVVMGAGNDRITAGPSFPSCVSSGISVGGVTKDDRIWEYINDLGELKGTNSGELMEIWAPAAAAGPPAAGETDELKKGVVTSWPGGRYRGEIGTSIATPHVAGAFALLRQRWPTANVEHLIRGVLHSGPRIPDNNVTRRRLDVSAAVHSLVHADFDDDTLGDLVWENRSATPANAFWFMNLANVPAGAPIYKGSAGFPAPPAGWHIAGTGDFNTDRKEDLLLHNAGSGQVAVWHMHLGTYQSSTLLASLAPAPWSASAVADFDRDGTPDIVWRNTSSGENAIWRMSWNGPTNSLTVAGVVYLPLNQDPNWRIVGAGLYDTDESVDLFWRTDTGDGTAVWLMKGTTYSGSKLLPATGDASWRIEAVGDLDRDGNTDLVWRNHVTGANALWRIDEKGAVTSVPLPSVADPSWYIVGPR